MKIFIALNLFCVAFRSYSLIYLLDLSRLTVIEPASHSVSELDLDDPSLLVQPKNTSRLRKQDVLS